MPISISDYLKIDSEQFAQTGAFNAILDVDSRLFIDPHLLQETDAPELKGSYAKLRKRFADVLRLLANSKHRDDPFRRQAARLLSFGEMKGLCIGYSKSGTSGSGMGPELRQQVLETAKAIVDAGISDPEIFELMPVLEEGVGSDRISDMVSHIILDDLLAYSERVFSQFNVSTRSFWRNDREYLLPTNRYNRSAIILVPQDILNNLPVAQSWDDIDIICAHNRALRERVNAIIGDTWKKATREKKHILKRTVLNEPELIADIVQLYRNKPALRYDFTSDPAGEFIWYETARRYSQQFPLPLQLPAQPTAENVRSIVIEICQQFKRLVEDNQLCTLLYNEGAEKPKHESAAQKLFYGIADSYCRANNLDLTAESDGGRGPVDFKISGGYASRVIVEAKLSTNQRLLHGFRTQTPEYNRAEQAAHSFLLVIDVGGPPKRLDELRQAIRDVQPNERTAPEVIFVDGRRKASASKYEPAPDNHR